MCSIIVREASLDDESAVQILCERNGLGRERSDGAWRWIWEGNKYYNDDWPLGWVLESDGEVVGFIGNIPRPYTFRGKLWIAGVARSFVVDKEFRSHTLQLVATFFKKNQADILIFSSCNKDAEAIFSLARAKKVPQPNYNKDLFWIVSPVGSVSSILRKKGLGKTLSILIARIVIPFIYLEMLFRRRWNDFDSDEVEIVSPADLTDEIDDFWRYLKISNPNRLLSFRDLEAIQWQFFNVSAATRSPKIFILRRKDVFCGYAIVTRADSEKYGLTRIMINDLIVRDDNPDMIRELVLKVFRYAKNERVALLQMVGFPVPVRSAIDSMHPFLRSVSYYPFLYHAVNPELVDELDKEVVWYASTFDGDSSI